MTEPQSPPFTSSFELGSMPHAPSMQAWRGICKRMKGGYVAERTQATSPGASQDMQVIAMLGGGAQAAADNSPCRRAAAERAVITQSLR